MTTLSECCVNLTQWSGLQGASCGGSSFTGIRKRLLIHDRSLFSQYSPSSHTTVLNVNLKGLKSPEVARFSESILETKYSPKRRMQIANRILTTGHRAPPLSADVTGRKNASSAFYLIHSNIIVVHFGPFRSMRFTFSPFKF